MLRGRVREDAVESGPFITHLRRSAHVPAPSTGALVVRMPQDTLYSIFHNLRLLNTPSVSVLHRAADYRAVIQAGQNI